MWPAMLAPITPRPIQPMRVSPGAALRNAMPGLIARETPRARDGAAAPADRRLDLPIRPYAQPEIRPFGPSFGPGDRRALLSTVDLGCPKTALHAKFLSICGSRSRTDRQAGRRTAMNRDLASNGTALWKGLGFALVLGIAACGGGGGGGSSAPPVGEETPPPPGPTETPGPDGECSEEFDGTFAGIQEVVFERQGCTQDVCHGSSAQ